ncbi:MAG: tyrosine-type recombinase/integrase [Amphritea sp.]
MAEIVRGTFNYAEKFPENKAARKFGLNIHKPYMKDLLEQAYKIKAGQLKASSLKAYRQSLDTHLLPAFGQICVDHMKPKIIRDWMIDSELSAKSLNNHRILLDFALDMAAQDEYISRNPSENIKLGQILPKKRINSQYEIAPLNKDEIAKMIAAADEWYRPMIIIWLFTGMRPRELIALTWEDINLDDRFIDINKSHVLGNEQTPKTEKSVRLVDMLPPVYDALLEQRKLTLFLDGEKGHVFRFKKSKKCFLDHRNLSRYVWVPTIVRAGIRYRNQYQARHTFASQMLTEGEDQWWIAQQMGLKGVEMLNRVYGKLIRENDGESYKPRGDWAKVVEKSRTIPI